MAATAAMDVCPASRSTWISGHLSEFVGPCELQVGLVLLRLTIQESGHNNHDEDITTISC